MIKLIWKWKYERRGSRIMTELVQTWTKCAWSLRLLVAFASSSSHLLSLHNHRSDPIIVAYPVWDHHKQIEGLPALTASHSTLVFLTFSPSHHRLIHFTIIIHTLNLQGKTTGSKSKAIPPLQPLVPHILPNLSPLLKIGLWWSTLAMAWTVTIIPFQQFLAPSL